MRFRGMHMLPATKSEPVPFCVGKDRPGQPTSREKDLETGTMSTISLEQSIPSTAS